MAPGADLFEALNDLWRSYASEPQTALGPRGALATLSSQPRAAYAEQAGQQIFCTTVSSGRRSGGGN